MTGGVLVASTAAAAAVLLLCLPRPAALRLREVLDRPDAHGSVSVPVLHRPLSGPAGLPQWGLPLAVVGTAATVALAAGLVPGVLAVLAMVAGRRWWRARAGSRSVTAERQSVLEACSVLAAELRAGRTSAEALQAAAAVSTGPSREVLRAGAASAGLGGDVAAVLAAAPPACAVADVLRSLSACWAVCSTTGSGLAAAVDRLEEGLRADEVLREALAAELAGPRATAGLLAVLPVVGLLLAAALGADPLRVLLHTPLGLVCLTAGLGLDVLGVLWTGRLVRRAGG